MVVCCLLTGSASCYLAYPIWALLACFHGLDYGNTSLQYDQFCCNIHTSVVVVHLRFVRAHVYSSICSILHVYVRLSCNNYIAFSLLLDPEASLRPSWWLFAGSRHCGHRQIIALFNTI